MKGTLATALNAAAMARDDKSNVAALGMARIIAHEDHVTFVVDALDRRIEVRTEATVAEPGEAAARCHALAGVIGGLALDQNVEIASHGDGVAVRASRSRFAIAGLPIDILPTSAVLAKPVASFDVGGEDLRRMLEMTEHAISNEKTRFWLRGLYLHIVDDQLRGVATDGHRLAWFDLPAPAGASGMPGVIIPDRIIAIVGKLVKQKPPIETVSLRVSESLLELSLPNLLLTANLIDGAFPDYARIIPGASGNTVTVDTGNLRQALKRINALFDEGTNTGMRAAGLAWSNGALHVSLTGDSETDDVIDDVETTGNGRFGARISYLIDALDAFNSKKIVLDANESGPIRITDPDNAAAFALVMPMRW